MVRFGDRLRELRIEKGLLQRQVAKPLSVSIMTVSGWERGTREPSIEMIKKLAKLLECDANYLIGFGE